MSAAKLYKDLRLSSNACQLAQIVPVAEVHVSAAKLLKSLHLSLRACVECALSAPESELHMSAAKLHKGLHLELKCVCRTCATRP